MIRFLLFCFGILLACPVLGIADEFRPAYLEISQTGPETYDLLWKRPALDPGTPLALELHLPPSAVPTAPVRHSFALGADVERWSVHVPDGLEGQAIAITNRSSRGIDILARYVRSDGTAQVERLSRLDPVFIPIATPGSLEVARTFVRLGVEHILTGADHLLFVAAMVFLVRDRRKLFWTITAFTLAHSLTLALATLGFLQVPPAPVEALIALSIVMVAAEALKADRGGAATLATQAPWLVAFAFGLLHGLGFAGALAQIGLPPSSIPLSLLSFNIGVEIGQVLFVVTLLSGAFIFTRLAGRGPVNGFARTTALLLIGSMASYWLIARISGLLA